MIFNCGIMEEGAIIQILSLLGVLEENCSKIPMKKKKKKEKRKKKRTKKSEDNEEEEEEKEEEEELTPRGAIVRDLVEERRRGDWRQRKKKNWKGNKFFFSFSFSFSFCLFLFL